MTKKRIRPHLTTHWHFGKTKAVGASEVHDCIVASLPRHTKRKPSMPTIETNKDFYTLKNQDKQ